MTLTAQALYEQYRRLYGSVPTIAEGACDVCLGRKTASFSTCIACDHGGFAHHIGRGERSQFIPLSTALLHGTEPPADWYRALREYKRTATAYQEHWHKLVGLIGVGFANNSDRIESVLGGRIDVFTVVPSSSVRDPAALGKQPFTSVVWSYKPIHDRLVWSLVATADKTRALNPAAFRCVRPEAIRGKRIVLLDDSWVTGGSALSARACLLAAGAASVVIVVAARVVNPDFARIEGGDPYHAAMLRPHDAKAWPR